MLVVGEFVLDTVDAIAILHKNGRITQALILLYAAIDTLAWLSTADPETSGKAFRAWVDRYMLPRDTLACTSVELYAARCGLLHTHTAESRTTASGTGRQIWYYTGEKSLKLLQYQAADRQDVTFVRFVDLLEAFTDASEQFMNDLKSDPVRRDEAQDKARRWLAWVPAPPAV